MTTPAGYLYDWTDINTGNVAAIGLIAWQSPARLFDSLALAALGICLGSLARYI